MATYYTDPIQIINRGLKLYDPEADAQLRQTRPLTKLPEVAYPSPEVVSLQAAGPMVFQTFPDRQKASCTRPQLDVAPDRIASMWYPICPTVENTIEPFERQGSNTRWQAKSRSCYNYSSRQ